MTYIRTVLEVFRCLKVYYKSIRKAFCVTSKLFSYIKDFECAKRLIDNNRPSLVVTFCDMHPADSLLTRYCSSIGIDTATLQHGDYSTDITTVRLTTSKYFLCYGITTQDFFQKHGASPDIHFEIVGRPQLIGGVISTKIKKSSNKILGIIFEGVGYEKSDITMLLIVDKYCKINPEYKIWIKFHPGYGPEKYNGFDFRKYTTITNQMNANDFLEQVSLIIVSVSTVFIECLINLVPVLVFENGEDYYNEARMIKFTDADDFALLVNKIIQNTSWLENYLIEIREKFTVTGHVKENYISFFNRFIDT
jgi:hypothetical protein